MVENQSMVAVVIGFVIVSIILSIGVTVLGNTQSGFDCTKLQGYNSGGATDALKYPSGTWSGQCYSVQQQTQSAFGILVIILIVIAAAAILYVVRMFG